MSKVTNISEEDVVKFFHKDLCEMIGRDINPELQESCGRNYNFTPGIYKISNVKPNWEFPNKIACYFVLRPNATGVSYTDQLKASLNVPDEGEGLGFLVSYANSLYPKFEVKKIA